jgi:hypothetical protein
MPSSDETQIAVRLNEYFINRLDGLARRGEMNRKHLMLSVVNIWLNVLEKSRMSHVFYVASILKDHEDRLNGNMKRDFSENRLPEKPIPIKFTEEEIFNINRFASFNHISRHQLLKTMIIISIEELDEATDYKSYQFGELEPKLYNAFGMMMKKGFKAFEAYIK